MPSWKGKSRGGAFGHRFFIFLINTLGIRFAYFFLTFVVIHFIPFAPLATRSNWFYYRKVLGYNFFKTIGMLYVNYYRFGQVIIDKVAVRAGMKDKYQYKFENYDEFLQLLNSNTGVILIGAHIGNWEIGSAFFGDYAKRINIVMVDAEYQKIKDVLEQNLDNTSHKIIPVSEQGFEHIYRIKDALDNKEYVCFQGDRYITGQPSQTMNFMGKQAKFPLGPFLLASKYKVPVVFYFSMREKGMQYRFKFSVASTVDCEKPSSLPLHLMKQYIEVLENTLRQYPEQWFNYYKFWDE